MLVLTRKINQEIILGDNITITILSQKGNQFKVGISAPKTIPISRSETHRKIKDSHKIMDIF